LNTSEVTSALVRLARRFYELGNVRFMTLVVESGYCEKPGEITEDEIRGALCQQPEFIHDWQILSEDKRTSGWFWERTADGNYEVKHSIGEPWRITEVLSYSDEASACAAFIKREIEDYRNWSERSTQ